MLIVAMVALALTAVACSKDPQKTEPLIEPEWDRSCSSDSECVPSPGCCPAPCTEDVINERELERANEWVEKHCDKSEECPSAGDCMTHAYLCVRGTCKLVYDDSPDDRERQP